MRKLQRRKNGRYAPDPRALCRTVDGEAVLLHLDDGEYFGLNDVGTRVWQLVGAGHSVPAICDQLVQEFDVERETLLADVQALLAELVEKGLVRELRNGVSAD